MFTVCMTGVCRSQRKALDPLELEFQRILSHCVVLENKPWSSKRATSSLNHRTTPSPQQLWGPTDVSLFYLD